MAGMATNSVAAPGLPMCSAAHVTRIPADRAGSRPLRLKEPRQRGGEEERRRQHQEPTGSRHNGQPHTKIGASHWEISPDTRTRTKS